MDNGYTAEMKGTWLVLCVRPRQTGGLLVVTDTEASVVCDETLSSGGGEEVLQAVAVHGDLERFVLAANCLACRPCDCRGGNSRHASQLCPAIPVAGFHRSEDIAGRWTGGVTLPISYENVVKPS